MTHYSKRSLLVALFFLTGHFGLLNRASAKLLIVPELAQNSDVIFSRTPRTDNLGSSSWWRTKVKAQATANQGKKYNGCLFGDSISSGIGNTLGEHTFNFGMGGLSSVSLVEQLKFLKSAHVKCSKAIIAVGTNAAWYKISNDLFIKKMKQAILLVRAMRASQVTLIPAFYSTVAASHNQTIAGSIQRVEKINALMRQVAAIEQVPIKTKGLQVLFSHKGLREDLTFDGVHLNNNGKKVYRQVLLKILSTKPLIAP